MSLAVAYMHGSSHMNTEEALWTDEYMNDRYSVSGKEHLFASIRCSISWKRIPAVAT